MEEEFAKETKKCSTQNKVKQELIEDSTATWSNEDPKFKEEIKTEFIEESEDIEFQASESEMKIENIWLKEEPIDFDGCQYESREPTVKEEIGCERKTPYNRRENYVRPKRLCKFCHKMVTQLKRHCLAVHKNNKEIQKLISMPAEEQALGFSLLRKSTIYENNHQMLERSALENTTLDLLVAERGKREKVKICPCCKGSYVPRNFKAHYKQCSSKLKKEILDEPLILNVKELPTDIDNLNESYETESSSDYIDLLLNSKRQDGILEACRSDDYLRYARINIKRK